MSLSIVDQALQAAADVLEKAVRDCAHCNYGRGATGKSSEGEPCPTCAQAREALRLVQRAMPPPAVRHSNRCDCTSCHYSRKFPQIKPHHATCGCFECTPPIRAGRAMPLND